MQSNECEAVGWLGASHALDADEYGVCRCTASDRRAARRRVFDATHDVHDEYIYDRDVDYKERAWFARQGATVVKRATREMAIEALWQAIEAQREAGR